MTKTTNDITFIKTATIISDDGTQIVDVLNAITRDKNFFTVIVYGDASIKGDIIKQLDALDAKNATDGNQTFLSQIYYTKLGLLKVDLRNFNH